MSVGKISHELITNPVKLTQSLKMLVSNRNVLFRLFSGAMSVSGMVGFSFRPLTEEHETWGLWPCNYFV